MLGNNPDRLKDSAGVPWEGRHFEANPHAEDQGLIDPALRAALDRFRQDASRPEVVVEALRSARLLVPLLAKLGESEAGAHGKTVDKSAELSIVTVQDRMGNPTIPVFSSVASMRAWNPKARPVVSDIVRICLASAQENGNVGRVVLDPASETEFVLRRPMIWALANQRDWVAPFNDPEVAAGIGSAITAEGNIVKAFKLTAADPRSRLEGQELAVVLWLVAGLNANDLKQLEQRLLQIWQFEPVIVERVDSMAIVFRDASELLA